MPCKLETNPMKCAPNRKPLCAQTNRVHGWQAAIYRLFPPSRTPSQVCQVQTAHSVFSWGQEGQWTSTMKPNMLFRIVQGGKMIANPLKKLQSWWDVVKTMAELSIDIFAGDERYSWLQIVWHTWGLTSVWSYLPSNVLSVDVHTAARRRLAKIYQGESNSQGEIRGINDLLFTREQCLSER